MTYTGKYKGLLFSGLFLSAVAMVLGMAPYICIWLVIKDLISAAPNWTQQLLLMLRTKQRCRTRFQRFFKTKPSLL